MILIINLVKLIIIVNIVLQTALVYGVEQYKLYQIPRGKVLQTKLIQNCTDKNVFKKFRIIYNKNDHSNFKNEILKKSFYSSSYIQIHC